jgi:hypothetical protein
MGRYEFPPTDPSPTGVKLAVWRDGDRLVSQFRGVNITRGAIDLLPESDTRFVLEIDGARLDFVKDGWGQATRVILHVEGFPDYEGKRVTPGVR